MSTTASTHNHRVPLIASAAVVAVIAGAGVVGLAWNSNDSASHQGQVLTPPTAQDYSKYGHYYHGQNYYSGENEWRGLDGHTPPLAPPAHAGNAQQAPGSPTAPHSGGTQVGQ
jgi:hypothetical protein